MREAGDESAQVLYVNYEKGMNSVRAPVLVLFARVCVGD